MLGDTSAQRVEPRVTISQDCLLVDELDVQDRPDLLVLGRSLLGSEPRLSPRRERVDACTLATEHELARVGVRLRTGERYGRYVITPCNQRAGAAGDELALALRTLRREGRRHGITCVADGAPTSTWTLVTDQAENPLAPGATPAEHLRFLFFGAAVLKAVDTHRGLLAAISEKPAVLSLHLGRELERVYGAIARGGAAPQRLPIGTFTLSGLGGSLGCTVLNTVVADALTQMTRAVHAWTEAGDALESAVREVIADTYRCHHRVVLAGFAAELDSPEVVRELVAEPTVRVFAAHGVLGAEDLSARCAALVERYAARLDIEARVAVGIARKQIGPEAERHREAVAPHARPAFERALRDVYTSAKALEAVVAGAAAYGLERARDLRHDVPPLLSDLRLAAARLERAQRGDLSSSPA